MKLVCDVCYSTEPAWEYMLSPNHQLRATLNDGTEFIDSGEWLLCDLCDLCAQAKNVAGLAERGRMNPTLKNAWFTMAKEHRERLSRRLAALAVFLIEHTVERKPWSKA